MKHVLLHQNWLEGWQYGTHKALEDEIIRQTNAEIIVVPENKFEKRNKRMEHGRRLHFLRKMIPKKDLKVEADVAWHVLMAPGDYNLDLFKYWYKNVKYRIVYVFDTLQTLEKALINAFSDDTFNIRITSFQDAVPYMEKITGQKWYSIEQAAPANFFECLDKEEKSIPFLCYGRRLPSFHDAVLEFTDANKLYYEFSTYNGTINNRFDPYMYRHYAWHVSRSIFNICWPVEITDKRRAGTLSPVTCRWFEAANAGCCILGRKPANIFFDQYFSPDLVIDINPFNERRKILRHLERIWQNRENYLNISKQIWLENHHRWTWQNRVERMLNLITETKA